MEGRRDSTFKNAVGKQLVCTICHDRVKTPKVLPCLHSFCRECLRKLMQHELSSARFSCPNCNAKYDKPSNGADHYPTNFTLANLVEVLEVHEAEEEQTKEIKCENGLDSNVATCKCVDCEIYLCDSCQKYHEQMRATKEHKVLKLHELKESRNLEYKRQCVEHTDEELKLYCNDCHKVICRDCTIIDHKDHHYDFIRSVMLDLESNLRQLLGKVTEKGQEFKGHLDYLKVVREESEANIDNCKEKIKEYFEVYRQKLAEKERSLVSELEDSKDGLLSVISVEHESVEVAKAKLDSAVSFTTQLLEKGIPVDVALMYDQTCQRLIELQTETWDRQLVQSSRYSFVEDDTRKNPFNSRIRSGISPGEISVEKLEQPVPGENTFNVLLSPEMDSSKANVVVKIMKDGIEEIGGVTSKETKSHVHEVSYQISENGVYVYMISVDGIMATGSPFKREWADKLARGTVIRRGKDWKWGDQDKSKSNRGIILGWSGEVGASEKWVKVKWENSRQNNYRWGAEGCYDLEIVVADDIDTLNDM